jgi:hypothetical protein
MTPGEIAGARIAFRGQGGHDRCRVIDGILPPELVAPVASNRDVDDEDADRSSIGEPRGRCSTLTDDSADILNHAYSEALRMRDDSDTDPITRFEALVELLSAAPWWLTEGALEEFDITPRIQIGQALAFPRLSEIRPYAIVVDWFTRARKNRGNYVFGQAGRASRKEREAWRGTGPAPWFRVELSLPWWLASWGGGRERLRLVCHELSHCGIEEDSRGYPRAVTVGHDVEEHCWVAREFGAWEHQRQRAFVDAVLAHDSERRAMDELTRSAPDPDLAPASREP